MAKKVEKTVEYQRMVSPKEGFLQPWDDWGAYVAERAWGTVREDYSADGNAWCFTTHDDSRSYAYHWSEDGIAAFCDRAQLLIFAPVFWNGQDPILKERMYGLTSNEGNHGEDLKEYYFYLDATPTQSYMKFLYKYPHKAYPYVHLLEENLRRSVNDREYELVDTGIFEENRYFDIVIEYAKASPDDICVKIEAFNRGPEKAPFHLIGQLWYRNRWTWDEKSEIPKMRLEQSAIVAEGCKLSPKELLTYHYALPTYYLYGQEGAQALFTNNETHTDRIKKGKQGEQTPFVKDAFHRAIINKENCLNPKQEGTKAGLHCVGDVPAGKSLVFYFRLSAKKQPTPFKNIEKIFRDRKEEADEYYEAIHPANATLDEKNIQRQALAGMLWSQQFYHFDVNTWFDGRKPTRNQHWAHLNSAYTISMPDKWEYPWFASWDLAFHTLPLGLANLKLGKNQLSILLREHFQHSNGQLPAYEWEFSDLNPPAQAWALLRLAMMEKKQTGKIDREFIGNCFHKLLINFGWWVNKVDAHGNNLFEGGFLGLDNISIIDRSKVLPSGEELEQSDGTGWIGFMSLIMMRLALLLSKDDASYKGLAEKFLDNFIYISRALENCDQKTVQMWSEEDGFFYDVLSMPDGSHRQLKVRSLVGIIPLFAISFLSNDELKEFRHFKDVLEWNEEHRPEFMKGCVLKNSDGYLFSLVRIEQIERVIKYVWDTNELRSNYGLRSVSKFHGEHPFIFENSRVSYEPGESLEKIKGGNSNWRGPVWVPTTFLLIDALKNLGTRISISDGGKKITPLDIAKALAQGQIDLFRQDREGNRPIYDKHPFFNKTDALTFFEHYHGDTGRGLGASHQTGWSGLVANLIDEWCR
jgi:Glycosyl hydrolase family 63 C-terminal domain